MKGSEKEVKWAEEIVAEGKATIARNIELNRKYLEQYGDNMYEDCVMIWEQIGAEYDKIIESVTDASAIIAKRNQLNSRALCYHFNQMIQMARAARLNK